MTCTTARRRPLPRDNLVHMRDWKARYETAHQVSEWTAWIVVVAVILLVLGLWVQL